MGALEIILLVVGLIIFSLSFIIPEKKESIRKEDNKIAEELVRELVKDQLSVVSLQMENIFDEKTEEQMERLERRMERLSNEKILAVGEYSDTVLGDIKKSHDEVVFLYDMLNAKHKSLNELLDKVDQTSINLRKDVEVQSSSNSREENVKDSVIEEGQVLQEEIVEPTFKPLQPKVVEIKKPQSLTRSKASSSSAKTGKKPTKRATNKLTDQNNVAIQFSKKNNMGQNSNDRILQLHKEGKSNMVIAKELGLGIGEVKLVIDLFKGI
jgi:hypothetical protein